MLLVSAPAGFGKTTLLAEWLAAGPRTSAVSGPPHGSRSIGATTTRHVLDLRDRCAADGGARDRRQELALLRSPNRLRSSWCSPRCSTTSVRWRATSCWCSTTTTSSTRREIQDAMAFLLDHVPPRLHLVIASRADPPLPLARLRARGELVEIRAADLRFTTDEAAAYLNEMMGLQLTARMWPRSKDAPRGGSPLCSWPPSRCRAATTSPGSSPVSRATTGTSSTTSPRRSCNASPRSPRLPAHTSILGRLSGPLCEAVTGQADAKAMLEALDRGNLFLVPLDDRRRWYRYHHLFADVLHARLVDEQPEQVRELHRRASDWYAENGEQSEAIRHAVAADDFERAADLVELAMPAMRQGQAGGDAARLARDAARGVVRVGPCSATPSSAPCCPRARSKASRRTFGMRSVGWTSHGRRPRGRRFADREGRRGRRGVPPSSRFGRRLSCRTVLGAG